MGNNFVLECFFASVSRESCNFYNENEVSLFEPALKKLGKLTKDEMYGFVPALPMGGRKNLKCLSKVPVITPLEYLSELQEKHIMQDVSKLPEI